MPRVIFLQGTFTPSVHAHAGRTQNFNVGWHYVPPHKTKLFGCEILRFKPVVISCSPRGSAFCSWRCWHLNELYFIALFFFGVENIVAEFFTDPFSSLVVSIPWQKSLPFPALLWCCQLGEIDIIAPCTSGLSVFLR